MYCERKITNVVGNHCRFLLTLVLDLTFNDNNVIVYFLFQIASFGKIHRQVHWEMSIIGTYIIIRMFLKR